MHKEAVPSLHSALLKTACDHLRKEDMMHSESRVVRKYLNVIYLVARDGFMVEENGPADRLVAGSPTPRLPKESQVRPVRRALAAAPHQLCNHQPPTQG
eukprot:scaffold18466_cov87-Skeletonema_dohrnii-CCMP3373.AAC.3